MTRDKRLLLLLGLLMAYGLFVAECRYHQRDDAAMTGTEARHRHRHRHESSNRRNHHDLDRRSWPRVDYDAYDGDSEDPIDEEDYDVQSYYDHLRSHHRSAQRGYHGRKFEPRYPPRYHDGHRGSWLDEDYDRYRIPSRYNTKNYRYKSGRTYHKPAYSRNHDVSDFENVSEDDYDYERTHRYIESDEADKHHEWWRNSRRHTSLRKDMRNRMNGYRGAKKDRLEDRGGVIDRADVSGWTDDWRVRSNISESKYHSSKDDKKIEEDEDYEDHGGLEEDDKDEEEDDIWKNADDEDNEDNEEEELDNDFYESKTKSPLKTYEDIIRRLTSGEPTTPKPTVKRDYRNIELNKHAKRDSYKNFNEPRNVSKPVDLLRFSNASRSAMSNYFVNRRAAENSTVKSVGSIGHKLPKNATDVTVKGNDRQEKKIAVSTKTKSLEDYDEYLNAPDNEKEDDLAKAGTEDDSIMQADVNNNVSNTNK